MSPKKAKKDGAASKSIDETKKKHETVDDSEAPIRCIRTELPADKRDNVYKVIVGLYVRDVKGVDTSTTEKKRAAHTEFARNLKGSLDISLGLNWHVLVGCSVGFACKKRSHSMGIYRLEKGLMAIIWRSPAAEGPVTAKLKTKAEPKAAPMTEAEAKAQAKAAKVLEPTEIEADSAEERVVALIRQQLQETPNLDSSEFPQDVRRRLTQEEGPIWHVLSGPAFTTCLAHGIRSRVLMESGQTRIMAFQHEQVDPDAGQIEWVKVLNALPYLLVIICAFGYMTLSSVCPEDPATLNGFRLTIRTKVCTEDYQSILYTFAAICFACMFVRRGGSIFRTLASRNKT